MGYFAAGTWKISDKGVTIAADCLAKGMSALEALEQGVMEVEKDPKVDIVGLGSYPNLHGECELDAGIMCGATLATGAVLGLKNFPHPISVAKRLMEITPHNIISGEGAATFASEQGFSTDTAFYRDVYERWFNMRDKYLAGGKKFPPLDACTAGWIEDVENIENGNGGTHDTVGMVAMDQNNNLAAATSTSGLALKMPGRIGDSPIIGSGFYADNTGGAAAATGVGEDIMRGCMSFLAVQFMTEGQNAQQAAEKSMAQVHSRLAKIRGGDRFVGKMALLCADKNGNIGAAANHDAFYVYYVKDNDDLQLIHAPQVRA